MGGININGYELNLTPDISSGYLQSGSSTISQPYGITEVDLIPFIEVAGAYCDCSWWLVTPNFGDKHWLLMQWFVVSVIEVLVLRDECQNV